MKRDTFEEELHKTLFNLEKNPPKGFFDTIEKDLEKISPLAGNYVPSKNPNYLIRLISSGAVAAAIIGGIFLINHNLSKEISTPDVLATITNTETTPEVKPSPQKQAPKLEQKSKKLADTKVKTEIQSQPQIILASISTAVSEVREIKIAEKPIQIEIIQSEDIIETTASAPEKIKVEPAQQIKENNVIMPNPVVKQKLPIYKRMALSVFSSPTRAMSFDRYSYTTTSATEIATMSASATNQYVTVKHYRPITVGINFICTLINDLSIETGLLFTMTKSLSSYTGVSNTYTKDQMLGYLGIPLAIKYNFTNSEKLRVYSSIGAMVEHGLYGYTESSQKSLYTSSSSKESERLNLSGLVPSLNIGAGVEYRVIKQLGLYAEPTINYYPDSSSQPTSFITENKVYFGIRAGLRIKLI